MIKNRVDSASRGEGYIYRKGCPKPLFFPNIPLFEGGHGRCLPREKKDFASVIVSMDTVIKLAVHTQSVQN